MSLASINQLAKSEQGVWQAATSSPFNYSDGEQAERDLHEILSRAQDLSSQSSELEAAIIDWPTEYHLTNKRANLLRPLDLSGVTRVLELGCGCGAISRYLGEQPNIQVDAVEGSPIRAALAAERCRDLDSVQVHCGNFNQLQFPESEYDLVLFVGVTEYAGRFSDKASDQEALQDLLGLAKRALKKDGVALVAIENRLGLKYVHGACEDHYGEPWIGLDDYPNSSGIRTYSRSQWLEQIQIANFAHAEFCYPFPDYKVPQCMVSEKASASEAVLTAICATKSRDYLRHFELVDEARHWQALAQANVVGEFANSFLILLGDDVSSLAKLAAFDAVDYAGKAYNWNPLPAQSDKETEQTRQLAELKQHNQHLQAQLDLLQGSRGWRWLSKLRRVLGR